MAKGYKPKLNLAILKLTWSQDYFPTVSWSTAVHSRLYSAGWCFFSNTNLSWQAIIGCKPAAENTSMRAKHFTLVLTELMLISYSWSNLPAVCDFNLTATFYWKWEATFSICFLLLFAHKKWDNRFVIFRVKETRYFADWETDPKWSQLSEPVPI